MTVVNPELSYLVGIGASAGGLEALQDFFQNMPPDTNQAFVVIQHLSSDYKSVMDELLQKHTSMPIQVVESTSEILPNHIYLISSRSNLVIKDQQLEVLEKSQQRLNLPIDLFFHSLGESYQERAVGVILSGTGTDGSRGAKTIKENEGLVMCQKPEEARFDGMPNAIVSQGIADFVLGAAELAQELARLAYHAPWLKGGEKNSTETLEPPDPHLLKRILTEVRKHCRIDFSVYRQQTIHRRLNKRMRVLNMHSLDDYCHFLLGHNEECQRLSREFLIGVTRFFRDPEAWDVLHDKVLPGICAEAEPEQCLRMWVAGCSTGEEAYSLAILVDEYLQAQQLQLDFKIFATDADEDVIHFASLGRYPDSIFTSISGERLSRYFDKDGESYVIKKQLRDHLVFSRHNLLLDPPFLKQDLICCRNLLIYFQTEAQRKVLSTLHFALRLSGYLFLGKSESLGVLTPMFRPLAPHVNVFQNLEAAKTHQLILDNYLSQSDRRDYRPLTDLTPRQREKQIDAPFFEQALLNQYVPTTIFVNSQGEMLYSHGETHPFIMFPRGRLRYDLRSMLKEQEYNLIQSGIQRARSERQPIEYQSVHLERGSDSLNAHICLRPLRHSDLDQDVFLIEFRPATPAENQVVQVQSSDFVSEQLLALRMEVQEKSQELYTLREKLETSNEELQASNEELLASNEELQSTNEELQSVNEELYTLNSELEAKIRSLAELNNDLNNFLNSTQIGLIFLDRNLQIRRFTPSIREVFNLYDSDMGRVLSHFTLRFDQAFDLERVARQVLHDGKVFELEVSVEHRQEYILRVLPYVTLDKSIEGLVLSLVNVTELNQVRRRVQLLDLRYRAIFDNMPHFLSIVDQSGKILLANQSHAFDNNAIGAPIYDLLGGTAEIYQESIQKTLSTGKPVDFETSFEAGIVRYFAHRICPLPGEAGQGKEIIVLSRDVTELREYQHRLQQAMEELKRTNAYLDSFVYAAAHDLRSPIANLISIIERMQRKPELSQEPMFPLLEKSVHSLDQTLGGLIEIIDVQKLSDQAVRPISITHLLEHILIHYPGLQNGELGKLELHIEVDTIHYIEAYLQSMLQNLLDNAVKYRDPERELRITLNLNKGDDDTLRLVVTDNGLGLPPQLNKDKIFRAFQRYHKQIEGKGIGLYLVKTLVEKNGGWVDVETLEQGGTRFILGLKEYEHRSDRREEAATARH